MEDQSRKNNTKFRGIPGTVKPPYLIPYIQQLVLKLLPQLCQADLIIDHGHQIAKPNNVPASVPRNTQERIHFFQIKERIMATARSAPSLSDPYSAVTLYMDISVATAQKQREFSRVTTVFREHNISYKWGFPTKLVVTYQNQSTNICNPKESIKRLLNWGLLISPPPDPQPQCPPMHNQSHRGTNSAP